MGLSRQDEANVGNSVPPQSLQLISQSPPAGQLRNRKADAQTIALLDNLPLYFIENRGQNDERVKYDAKIRNGRVYFTGTEIVYQFLVRDESKNSPQENLSPAVGPLPVDQGRPGEARTIQGETVKLSFVGANKEIRLEGREEQEAKFSYFRGKDPRKWVSAAPSFQKVAYRDLYPHIDLVVSGREGRMKNEYVVRPGGDPAAIRLKYDGAKALRVNEKGQLEVQTSKGLLIEDVPLSYQVIDGHRQGVRTEFQVTGEGTVQFEVSAYRENAELVIDPLTYSTFLGGASDDYGYGIAVDGSGNAYLTGSTYSDNFPATSYDFSHNGNSDVFLTKLNSWGTDLLYSAFLGGAGDDYGYGIAVDGSGNAYVTGYTESSDFPTTSGAYDTSHNGNYDVFLTKLDSSGTALLYSTFLGGTDGEEGMDIAVDGSGNAYVSGRTNSGDFPTTSGAYDRSRSGIDVFLTKLNSSGGTLLYSTFLGGTSGERVYAIAVDGSGNAYVTGYTESSDFPTTSGAYDTSHNGNSDVFLTKLNSSGTALLYSTFLGGTDGEEGRGIAVDGSGNAHLTGYTYSSSFPTTSGAYDTSFNGLTDAFVTKLNSSGSALLYSTFLGGPDYDFGRGIAVDGSGNAYVIGGTASSDFPTTSGAYDTSHNGNYDVFLIELNSSGTDLPYSTFLGGWASEEGFGIVVDGSGYAYLTGTTGSSTFPTTSGAYDISHSNGSDAFVTKLFMRFPDVRQPIADINFGNVNVGGTSDQTTTIYNDGEAALTVNSISRTSGSTEFTYVGPNLPFAVSAGGYQAVTIRFASASGGSKSAVFNVNSDDPDEADATFNASGTGAILTETVSTPSTPVGTTSGYIGTSYSFATGNSTSNLGHSVQYYFDWGDGTNSGWLAVGTFSAQKSWSSANTYNVTAKARCATDTAIESSVSSALAVSISVEGRDNSPSNYQIIPECIWAVASGGGTWVSEVQVSDITGGSLVSVYFNYGAGNRRGPFTLWTSPGANQSVKYFNILSSIDALDAEAFTYYGRVGAVEFSTQDASHRIQVAARTLNGNYSKTFPGLNLKDANTASITRRMMIQNFSNNATYRSSCGFFNPTANSVTIEFRLLLENGTTIGSPFTRTLVGYDFQSFSPFNQAGVSYPTYSYDNVVLWITPTSGSGKVMIFGASANNTSNDPAAHIGVQYQ